MGLEVGCVLLGMLPSGMSLLLSITNTLLVPLSNPLSLVIQLRLLTSVLLLIIACLVHSSLNYLQLAGDLWSMADNW